MSWIENSEASDLFNLQVDQTYYNVTNGYAAGSVWLYALAADCYRCPFVRLQKIDDQFGAVVNSANDYWLRVYNENLGKYVSPDERQDATKLLCQVNGTAGAEFGAYNLVIGAEGDCNVSTLFDPVNIYLRKLITTNYSGYHHQSV